MINVLIALALGVAILAIAVWMIRLLAMPEPPEPTDEDLVEVNTDYRCIVCGLRLTVTQVQGNEDTAPKHCREEMVLA